MSRFVFNDLERPKRAAKKLLTLLAEAKPELTLSGSREIVADMLGFKNWHQLTSIAKTDPASEYDDQCSATIAESRRARQNDALLRAGADSGLAAIIVSALHLTNVRIAQKGEAAVQLDIDTPWWKATSCVQLPEGLIYVETQFSSGYGVPKTLLQEMPQLLRSKPDHNGFAWYEADLEDCLVPIALSRLFPEEQVGLAQVQAKMRYPDLIEALKQRRRMTSWELRSIRPHRIGRPRPFKEEFFSLHIKGTTFLAVVFGNDPDILAYEAGNSSNNGAYLGVTALMRSYDNTKETPDKAVWGIHKYSQGSQQNFGLPLFDENDALKLGRAFGIDIGDHRAWPFYASPAFQDGFIEWARKNPRRFAKIETGNYLDVSSIPSAEKLKRMVRAKAKEDQGGSVRYQLDHPSQREPHRRRF